MSVPDPLRLQRSPINSNQITAQREKYSYAEQPALGPAQVQVVGDNSADGKSAQPVKARKITLTTTDGLRQIPP